MLRVHTIYRDADLSSQQRQRQAADTQRRIIALQIRRGVDPDALAAAHAEQTARTQLAAHATHTTAASHKRLLDIEAGSTDRPAQSR